MIIGIGIDIVQIKRFALWHTYSFKQLHKIFSKEEIDYCLHNPGKTAERFAARFAAREAFFKALGYIKTKKKISLRTILHTVFVIHNDQGSPLLHIKWDALHLPQYKKSVVYLSFTHEKEYACAVVIIEKFK